jgi:folate-binding protein YgfZ
MAATDISQLDSEYLVLTESCGLLDRSERGKLALTGSGAKEFLAGQVTNDTEVLAPGSGCYAAFLTPKGKMLGDLRILDVGEELLLDTERVALQALFDMIHRFKIGYDVQLHKRTLECSMLSLIGPTTTRIIDAEGLAAAEHANARAELEGIAAVLARTDIGVDIICDAADHDAVHETLLSAGAQPVSAQAAEIVRVEYGRPRYGIDLDETVIPQEAGLNERAVSFTKGCYVGQETVAELHLGERPVGRLSSSVRSPVHGSIGLALVRREAEPGSTVSVGEHGASAEVIEPPFQPR